MVLPLEVSRVREVWIAGNGLRRGDALRETQERKVAHAQLLCHQAASPSTCTPPSTSCLLPLKIKW